MNDHQRKLARKAKKYAEGGEIEQTPEQRDFIEKMKGKSTQKKETAPPPPPPPPPEKKKEGVIRDSLKRRLGEEYAEGGVITDDLESPDRQMIVMTDSETQSSTTIPNQYTGKLEPNDNVMQQWRQQRKKSRVQARKGLKI